MARLPKVKLQAFPVFPSLVQAVAPILLAKVGAVFTFSLDINAIADSLSPIFAPVDTGTHQEITSGPTATIDQNAKTVRVNQTVSGAIALTVPDSNLKTCDVLVSDWKGDSGSHAITLNLSGADKFPGGLTSWTIAADGGSIFLRRIPGVGYLL